MKAVYITIIGEQYETDTADQPADSSSFRIPGRCWKAKDGLKISYQEPKEADVGDTTTTVTVLQSGAVSVNRVGFLNTGMIFERGVPHACIYDTGFFQFQVTIRTHALENSMTENGGCIDIDYSLDIGGQSEGRNHLKFIVTPAAPLIQKKKGSTDTDSLSCL